MSKRFKKLPEKTSELPSEGIEKLIPIIKKNCTTKFDESIDLSLRLNLKQSKGGDFGLRTVIKLPNGSGKKEKIAVLCEQEKVEEDQKEFAGQVANMAIERGYNVSARVHVYLFGNAIGT